jgi:hypothetical protein
VHRRGDRNAIRLKSCIVSDDYKIELSNCDPLLEFVILTSEEIRDAVAAMHDNYAVCPAMRLLYENADNSTVVPLFARAFLEAGTPTTLEVSIHTRTLI